MNSENLFDGIARTEYVIDEGGYRIPHSDFDRPKGYYDKTRERDYSGDEYANMCVFKDKGTALYDKRRKSVKDVIDLVAKEIGIDPETCGLYLYGLVQAPHGDFESPLVDRMREWFSKSGEKTKL